jgi:hypothetical protein
MMLGDISRKLVLDLHRSVLITRGGRPNSRFLVCADGSAAAKRQFYHDQNHKIIQLKEEKVGRNAKNYSGCFAAVFPN